MRHVLIALFGAALYAGCSQGWTPSKNPDPDSILDEARADAKAKKYADALAKEVWFYRNALKYKPSLAGVRLSYALAYWSELGEVYPPALEKMKNFRDEAEKDVREGKSVEGNFEDFEAMNGCLKEDARTVSLFVWLDSQRPDSAKMVFGSARPALIRSRRYALLGKYIHDPRALFGRAVRAYEMEIGLSKDPAFGRKMKDSADRRFIRDSTTLIALLVVTGRKADAERIEEEIKNRPGLPSSSGQIQKAFAGEFPGEKEW